MIEKATGAYWPNSNMPVWRYLSFDKFVSLLLHGNLQFTRASYFTDQNEFIWGASKSQLHQIDLFTKKTSIEDIKDLKNSTYISCWSLGHSESYPLWKIYLHGSPNGIAIRSTVGRLENSLENSKRRYICAGVTYKDRHHQRTDEITKIIFSKNEAYSYEREFRIYSILSEEEQDSHPSHISESIDLGYLLKYIFISPFSNERFEETVRETIHRIAPDLEIPIIKSQIKDR